MNVLKENQNGFLTNVALAHDENEKIIKIDLTITPQVGDQDYDRHPQI